MKISGDFRSRVLAREWLTGTFINLGSAVTAEIAGQAGYDWLVLDHEHGFGGEETLIHQLLATAGTPAVPIVRIPVNDPTRFKRALDAGAHGVMVPYVNTAAEAQAAVTAMQYPPHGLRGVAKFNRGSGYSNNYEEYYTHAHEWLVLVAQLETAEAVDNCEAIAAVPGVDVVFVGPNDLTHNLGIRDQFDHPKFVEALKRVSAAAAKHKKVAGILVHNPALVAVCRGLGYTFVSLGSDGGVVNAGLRQNLAVLKAK